MACIRLFLEKQLKPDSDVLFSARLFVVLMDYFLKSVIYRFTDL